MLKLVFCNENAPEWVHDLADGKTTVGRSASSMIAIPDESVSRKHGEVLTWGGEVIVRDLGSRNGTWVGDKPVRSGQCQVKPGELLRFGSVPVRLEADPADTEARTLSDALEDVTAIHHHSQIKRIQERRSDSTECWSSFDASTPTPAANDPYLSENTMLVTLSKQPQSEEAALRLIDWEQSGARQKNASVLVWTILGICSTTVAILLALIFSKA